MRRSATSTRVSTKAAPVYAVDVAGLPYPEAPEWTIAAGAQYSFDNGFYFGGDMKYTSEYMSRFGLFSSTLTAPNFVDSRVIVNLQAGYRAENWEINAFIENAFDEDYFTYVDGESYATLGERRLFGVNVKATF